MRPPFLVSNSLIKQSTLGHGTPHFREDSSLVYSLFVFYFFIFIFLFE